MTRPLRLRVARLFGDTQLQRILDEVRAALRSYEYRLSSGDRVAQWFTPAVVAIALLAWLGRLAWFGPAVALQPAAWLPSIAVMVVACPCAFSLAGISAISAAVGALLRHGIVVKEPAQLERLHTIEQVVFDKTGTLTHAGMAVEAVAWQGSPQPELWPHILAVESSSRHPVAQAICGFITKTFGNQATVLESDIEEVLGQGRRCRVAGRTFAVGGRDLFADKFTPVGVTDRHSLVWFGFDGQAVGCVLLADQIRAQAACAVQGLRAQGLTLEIFSGDRPEVCQWVGAAVGISKTTGNLSVAEKSQRVQACEAQGQATLYVGDGTNDATAMACAAASVALRSSTDDALLASGFVLADAQLSALPLLLAFGRRVRRVIQENYAWALVFNAVFIPIAIVGQLTPLLAMILMLASSITVLANALRLRKL